MFDFRRQVEKPPKFPVMDDDIAECWLGIKYIEGDGVKKDESLGLHMLQNAAAKYNNSAAQLYLATMALEGRGVVRNIKYGLKYLRDAVANENADARFLLGQLYLFGDYVERNEQEGARLIELSANQGHKKALRWLSDMTHKGIGTEQNLNRVMPLLQTAAQRDDALSHHIISAAHIHGHGVKQSGYKAALHFTAAVLNAREVIEELDMTPSQREALLSALDGKSDIKALLEPTNILAPSAT